MKSKQFNRNIYIIVSILFIFAAGYYLYLEVYTKGKEANIIATKSRILEQMSFNLEGKVKSMGDNAVEYVRYLAALNKKDSIIDNLDSNLVKKKDILYYNDNLEYLNLKDNGKLENVPEDSLINVKPNATGSDSLYYRLVLGKMYGKYAGKTVQFTTKYNLLMAGLNQSNVFSDYILIVDRNIVYSSLLNKPNLSFIDQKNDQTNGVETNSEKETSSGIIDIGDQSKATIRGVTTYDINISNNSYKLFLCQMKIEGKTFSICGLVKTELINQAKKGIAPWVAILVFMVLSFIILGLPFIKLKVMSPTEELTSGNLLNSAISLFLGTSFITLFIFFGTNAFWNRNQNETKLKALANDIKNSLNTEIDSAFNQLDAYDRYISRSPHLVNSFPGSAKILMNDSMKPCHYPYFDYAFWIGADGMQKGVLTPFSKLEKPSNLSKRDYFQNAGEWMLPGKDTCRFRMESIVSKTSGIVKVALSKRSDTMNKVIAMTGRFYSIIEPILPLDYKFCIIDKSGLVWFHSDKLRNMQENFRTVCSEDENLTAAIYANATRTLDLNYYDEPYRIHIKPLAPIPLYLVTMFDKHAEYAYQVQGLMLTLLLYSALVMFIIIEIIAIYALTPIGRKSGWKNLIKDFVGARESHIKIYIVMSILFVAISALYLLLTHPVNILNPLLFALIMVSFLLPFLKYAINGFSLKSSGRNLFAVINVAFLILINISSVGFLSSYDFIKMLIFQGAIIVLLVACFYVLQSGFTIKNRICNVAFYVCFLLGMLLVFSVVPSIKFFEASVNHEIIRGIKHDQLMLARQRESRNRQLRKAYKRMELEDHTLDPSVIKVYEHRMELGIYSKFDSTTFYIKGKTFWKEMESDSTAFITIENDRANRGENIINFFRPIYDSTSIETKYLESNSLQNGDQIWSLRGDTSLVFDYRSTTEKYGSQKPVNCRISTNFQRPNIFNPQITDKLFKEGSIFQKIDIVFILLLLSFFYGIYFLILFGTRRMLGISIIEMHTEYDFGNFIHEQIASGLPVMVISSPFVNLAPYVKEKLKDDFKLTYLDFAKPENLIVKEKRAGEKDVHIIRNFAFDYYSPTSLKLQLDTITVKIRNNEKLVIIGLNSPYLIQDYLEQKSKLKGDLKEKDKPDAITETWEQLLLSFNNILTNVNILYAPEKYDQQTPRTDCSSGLEYERLQSERNGDYDENLRCLIRRELAASTYLNRYSYEMTKFYDKLIGMEIPGQIIKDRIIARIMDLSQLYYDNILHSCTPIERFVLSDMAQDMIVNSKNQKIVFLLIQRGLFVVSGCAIRFMNESFRKHVVLRFTDEERARLKEKLGDTGTSWQGYKLFLVLIMIGLFSFLFIANKAILDNLNKLFLVIGGGTVLLTNLTGFLTRKETGDTK